MRHIHIVSLIFRDQLENLTELKRMLAIVHLRRQNENAYGYINRSALAQSQLAALRRTLSMPMTLTRRLPPDTDAG